MAFDAASTAPDEFVSPDQPDVNREDESVEDILKRVPR
jgi:hypothetical protein